MNYKGQLSGFPKKVVDLMLIRQVEQGNPADVSVFEENIGAGESQGGFIWTRTPEGHDFWVNVIAYEQFNLVPESTQYPKVMWVWNYSEDHAVQRVVFMEKNGKYVAWGEARTLDQSEKSESAMSWKHAKDIEPEQVELTIDQIAEKFGVEPNQIKIKK